MEIRRLALALALSCAVLAPVMASGSEKEGEKAGVQHAEPHLNWFDFSHWIGDNKDETPPLIAMLINFGLMVYISYLILRKPLGRRFRDRRSNLQAALKEAADMKARAEEAMAAARAKMERIDQEMAKIRSELLEAGKSESAAIVEKAEHWAKRMRSDTEAMIEQEIALVAHEIREKLADEIVKAAEKLVRERINLSDHERINAEYLDAMRADKPAEASKE